MPSSQYDMGFIDNVFGLMTMYLGYNDNVTKACYNVAMTATNFVYQVQNCFFRITGQSICHI